MKNAKHRQKLAMLHDKLKGFVSRISPPLSFLMVEQREQDPNLLLTAGNSGTG